MMGANELQDLSFSKLLSRYPILKDQGPNILAALSKFLTTAQNGGHVWAFGNGGSSADAEHFCGELTKSFINKRSLRSDEQAHLDAVCPELKNYLRGGIGAIALSSQHSSLSAFSNDADFRYALAQLVWAVGQPKDIAFGISTSGNSENVVHALQAAKAKGLVTIALTGESGGRCLEICDVTIRAPGKLTHEVQELHLPIYHAICLELEHALWGSRP